MFASIEHKVRVEIKVNIENIPIHIHMLHRSKQRVKVKVKVKIKVDVENSRQTTSVCWLKNSKSLKTASLNLKQPYLTDNSSLTCLIKLTSGF